MVRLPFRLALRQALVVASCFGATLLLILLAAIAANAATFTVDSTGDASDANAGDGTCATAGSVCTFRAAIEEANALSGADTIEFGIAGGGVHTIAVNPTGCSGPSYCTDPWMQVTEALTIDGFTQTGASAGDLWGGTAPTWTVRITTTYSTTVLRLNAAVTVRGLWLKGVRQSSPGNETPLVIVDGDGGDGSTVAGNLIETSDLGISVRPGATNVTVGGASAGDGNVIVDTGNEGVLTQGATGTVIEGNFCGVEADGQTANPALSYGCLTTRSASTTVRHNLVAGNHTDGIVTETNPDDASVPTSVSIVGNRVGLALDGSPLANWGSGITLKAGDGVTIGGAGAGRNVVAANLLHGLDLSNATNVTVTNTYVGVTTGGVESADTCNRVNPQVQGSYTDGGGNVVNASCTTATHCCQVADASGIGHAGPTCVDNTWLLSAIGSTVDSLGGCAGVAGLLSTSVSVDGAGTDCSVPGSLDATCVALTATPTPTATGTTTATRTATRTRTPTPTGSWALPFGGALARTPILGAPLARTPFVLNPLHP